MLEDITLFKIPRNSITIPVKLPKVELKNLQWGKVRFFKMGKQISSSNLRTGLCIRMLSNKIK